MKINKIIKLSGNYEGYFADIDADADVDERGYVFVVVDFDKKNNNPNLNIVPCKIIHVFEEHYVWIIRRNHIVVSFYNFFNK